MCPKRAKIPAATDMVDIVDSWPSLIRNKLFVCNSARRIRLTGSPAKFSMFLMVFCPSNRCLTNCLTANPHDLLAALGRDFGLLLDTHPGVHLRLNVVAQRRNKLSVTLLDSLHSVGEHLSHFENTNAARQHVAGKRIAEAVC